MQPRLRKLVRQSMGGVRERPFQPDWNPGSLPCALTAATHSAPSKANIIVGRTQAALIVMGGVVQLVQAVQEDREDDERLTCAIELSVPSGAEVATVYLSPVLS